MTRNGQKKEKCNRDRNVPPDANRNINIVRVMVNKRRHATATTADQKILEEREPKEKNRKIKM